MSTNQHVMQAQSRSVGHGRGAVQPAEAAAIPRRNRTTVSPQVVSLLATVGDIAVAACLAAGIGLVMPAGPVSLGEGVVLALGLVAVLHGILSIGGGHQLALLLDPVRQLPRLGIAVIVVGLALGASALMAGSPAATVWGPLAWIAGWAAVLGTWRLSLAHRLRGLRRDGRLARKVAVIGATDQGLRLVYDLRRDDWFQIVGVFDDRPSRLPALQAGLAIDGSVNDLVRYARENPVDTIVIALPLAATDQTGAMLARLNSLAVDILMTGTAAAEPALAGEARILGTSPVFTLAERPISEAGAFCKAVFDRVGSAVLLVMLLPLMLAISLAIKLDSPGPVLFRQDREGLNGAFFAMLKFRSMRHGGHDQSIQATRNDRRVTRVGGLLRRMSLDELPQLLNVFRGEMSLVGPRPHLASTRAGERLLREIVANYDARHRVKPGMTGWAQVNGLRGETRTEAQVAARIAHDLHYIEHWSILFDVTIILRTLVSEVCSRSGNAF